MLYMGANIPYIHEEQCIHFAYAPLLVRQNMLQLPPDPFKKSTLLLYYSGLCVGANQVLGTLELWILFHVIVCNGVIIFFLKYDLFTAAFPYYNSSTITWSLRRHSFSFEIVLRQSIPVIGINEPFKLSGNSGSYFQCVTPVYNPKKTLVRNNLNLMSGLKYLHF